MKLIKNCFHSRAFGYNKQQRIVMVSFGRVAVPEANMSWSSQLFFFLPLLQLMECWQWRTTEIFRKFQNDWVNQNGGKEKALCTLLLDSSLIFQSTQRTGALWLLHCIHVHFGNTQRSVLCAQNTCDKFCQRCDTANSFFYLSNCYIYRRIKEEVVILKSRYFLSLLTLRTIFK